MNFNSFRIACLLSILASTAAAQSQPSYNFQRPDPAYTLTQVPDGAVLVHNATGKSWWLLLDKNQRTNHPKVTWLPITRVEDYGAVAKWLRTQDSVRTRSVVDVEIAFARAQLKEARENYGTRHPTVIKLTQDLMSLEKAKRTSEKPKATRNNSSDANTKDGGA